VLDVKRHPKGVTVFVSRNHPDFIKALFKQEVPEISSGIVEIVDVAREAGRRCKVSVTSNDHDVEAIGACIGERGCRINVISHELSNEKIDLVNWYEDICEYVASALNPAQILEVRLHSTNTRALVVVYDDQISLAIGKGGQNVRLASRLVGIPLDVKTRTQVEEQKEELKGYFYESLEDESDNN
jgi:N utilization substance protein A